MPQRFLRPGIRTSAKWNSLSFEAQSLYISILTLVDDFGRYDGRAALLHGECFSLRDDVKPQRTAALRSELHEKGLILLYESGGKEYLQITNWHERTRSETSKFPTPPQDSAAERSGTQGKDASIVHVHVHSHKPSPSSTPSVEVADFRDTWNAAEPLPDILTIGGQRLIHLKARLSEPFFRENWRAAILRLSKSDFACGRSAGKDGQKPWVAGIDWFLKPDSITKIMEGNYDNRTNGSSRESSRNKGTANEGISHLYKMPVIGVE